MMISEKHYIIFVLKISTILIIRTFILIKTFIKKLTFYETMFCFVSFIHFKRQQQGFS